MRGALFAAALSVTGLSLGLGCQGLETKSQPPFEILVKVESDPGRPLAGAVLVVNGRERGTTQPDGRARLTFVGNDGDTFDLWVRCPDGYSSPTKPVPAALRRLSDPSKLPQYDATCAPNQRIIVVAVRADNGANLPVMHLNKEVARTDSSGAAHVYLPSKPGDSFELVISTAERGNEKLRPQNPSQPFIVRGQDEVFLFEQRFSRDKEPVKYVAQPKKPTHL